MSISAGLGGGGLLPGLVLLKKQDVGSTVSSVTVTGAFSADYNNYKVIYAGGSASVSGEILITLKAGASTLSSWYYTIDGFTYLSANTQTAGVATAGTVVGGKDVGWAMASFDLLNPYAPAAKMALSNYVTGTYTATANGVNTSTAQYTDLYLYPASGTLSGGTIRIYGYRNQ